MGLAAIAEDRCTRCSRTDERRELLRDAVVESARAVMARFLVWERLHCSDRISDSIDAHYDLEHEMQGLRDACAAERKARG